MDTLSYVLRFLREENSFFLRGCDPFVSDLHAVFVQQFGERGEGVWAVIASVTLPTGRHASEGQFEMTLCRGWEKELCKFVFQTFRPLEIV